MVFTPWNTAHGEAQEAFMQCADIVPISPADDSVDTNNITIEGAGNITSFGDCSYCVIKRIKFVPLVLKDADERAPPSSANITLVNSAILNLLGKKNRSFSNISYGTYQCEGNSHWYEIYFTSQGSALASDLEERIAVLEARLK